MERTKSVESAAGGPRVIGRVSSASAFELVATSEGALLLWAQPGCGPGNLRAVRIGADGVPLPQGETRVFDGCAATPQLDSGEITELAAAASGGKLGVAFIVQDQARAIAVASHGADDAQVLAPFVVLSEVETTREEARGRLSLRAAEDGPLRVSFRTPRKACVAEPGRCSHIVSQSLPSADRQGERVQDAREVARPCPGMIVGATWVAGVWYDAFCTLSEAGEPTTSVYAIRPEVFYAEVVEALPHCVPFALSPAERGALVWGQCADGLRAQTLLPETRGVVLAGADRYLRCEQGRPVLEARAATGERVRYGLSAARDRLEAWLPTTLAPPGARAVFTGRTLVLAYEREQKLRLSVLACRGHELVSDRASIL